MAEFQSLLDEYQEKALMSVKARKDAALLEIERAEWVNRELARLMDEEGLSVTRADKQAHAHERHREYQREVAKLTYEAERWDRLARVLSFQIQMEIKEGVTA